MPNITTSNKYIFSPNLRKLFDELLINNIKIVVLRSHERLPDFYRHDLDVHIRYSDIPFFFSVVTKLFGEGAIEIVDSRYGLVKIILKFHNEVIEFDIAYGFYFGGIAYYDENIIMNAAIFDRIKRIYTPLKVHEIDISILKELLHNGRMRAEKSDYLINGILNPKLESRVLLPLELKLIIGSIKEGRHSMHWLQIKVFLRVFFINIKTKGIKALMVNILNHIRIKYFGSNLLQLNK